MKLILMTPEWDAEKGGVGRYLHDLYSHLPPGAVEVVSDEGMLRRHWLFLIPRAVKLLSSDPHSVLHVSHLLPLGTVAMVAGFITRRPYVVSLHGLDFFSAIAVPRKRALARLILKRAALVTTNSNALAREVETFAGRDAITIHPSLPRMHSVERSVTPLARRQLVAVARLVPRKGIDLILEMLALAPDLELAVVGHGSEQSRLEAIAVSRGIADRVRFHGQVSDEQKNVLLANADLFLMPTKNLGVDREGFGIVYLEAQYFGVPVVAGVGIGVVEALHPDLLEFAQDHSAQTLLAAARTLLDAPPNREKLRRFAVSFDQRTQSKRFWKLVKSLSKI